MSFVERLDADSLAIFNEISKKPFSEQCCHLMDFFQAELEDQFEVIYTVAWETIKAVDMRNRNVKYYHLYDEGNDLDFDMALHFFELLVKFYEDKKNAHWKEQYPRSVPRDMTAITRKKEIREKVDVNFDGRVSFLEYLLYQYDLSPKDLLDRSKGQGETNEALEKAKAALEDVNRKIREYEAEKARLEEIAASNGGKGVRALGAQNQLFQLGASPLAEQLRKLLITAEAAVRLASKGLKTGGGDGSAKERPTGGSIWWLNRELKTKKEKYGARNSA